MDLERGSFITSRDNFAEATGLSVRETRTFWALLESDQMIARQSTNRMTKLIVLNYERYQDERPANDQPTSSQRPAKDQPETTEKKEKKEKKEKESKEVFMQTAKAFYKKEFEIAKSSSDAKTANAYFRFIGTIYNTPDHPNALEKPARHILKLEKQLRFQDYWKLVAEAKKRGVNLWDKLEVMINDPKYLRGKKSLYLTLLGWVKREEIKGTNF